MADLLPVIETMEHRWMRAWIGRDIKVLKSLTARNFILLTATKPPMILDVRSFLDAAAERYSCNSYRFSDIYVRDLGSTAIFASQVEMEATVAGEAWSGPLFVTDLWRKGRVRRGWRLAQRVISKADDNRKIPAAIRALQLWR